MKILGFAGKKESGKNTAANCIVGGIMNTVGFKCRINDKGELLVWSDDFNDMCVLDINSRRPDIQAFLCEEVWPMVKLYSFADQLKQFCIHVLGLTERQCYGTNDDKDSLTNLLWESMPGVITNGKLFERLTKTIKAAANNPISADDNFMLHYHEPGQMTAREVLQFFGTQVVRKIYNDAWVKATIKQIMFEQPAIAIVTDVRFPNEVVGIQNAGGKVVRLLRAPHASEDTDASETALDSFDKFDAVIDNSNMTITEQAVAVGEYLEKWSYVNESSAL